VKILKIGIVGGSGYVGGELLRILLFHPNVDVTMVTSRKNVGEYIFNVHPNLRGSTQLKFVPQNISELQNKCDLVFTATPHGSAVNIVPDLLQVGLKVIDMSADFRLKDPYDYDKWYGWKHTNPELLAKAVYGLPELHRTKIKNANLIACPGCMATAAILGLAPIVKADLVEKDKIIVDLKVGSSGGGAKPTIVSHHPERFGGVRPYNVINHRHIAEVQQELNELTKTKNLIAFTPHSVNMVRGILATIHAFPNQPIINKDVWNALRELYVDEPFIRLVKYKKGPYKLPNPKVVLGTNFCDIGFEIDPRTNRLLIFSAIDNMIKGASGQGIQCLNILMGVPEKTGINSIGFHPM
jgi:N-acetyl-gamma-glutamyl-phosphate/LysW-gamma-L-alpha-aminoadipyl-6-phosphate reductase